MNHLEIELNALRSSLLEMWSIVISQHEKAKMALETGDRDLANEIHTNEKLLDAFELKHDMDCENLIVLNNPVAVDLRFILAVLKINYNLERIGDYANYIANSIRKSDVAFDSQLLKDTHVFDMFDISHIMLVQAYDSFEKNDVKPLRNLSDMDKKLDHWNKESFQVLGEFVAKNPGQSVHALELFSIIRKLERVGDHNQNIAEEIVFYLDARVIKHKKLQKKTKPE
ncbi:MAG: phosphate signaling complex protein PhoU [Bacteroidales bacterium]|jgi:phosphate transport system protein|nr:phosphate signaling complex protein PhoU [Bacteroidales bacterium]